MIPRGVITPHPISSHGVDVTCSHKSGLLFHLAHQKAEFTSVGAVLWSQLIMCIKDMADVRTCLSPPGLLHLYMSLRHSPSLLCLAEPVVWV